MARRRRSSSCISSPGCPSRRPPRRSASRARPLTDTGPTPGRGSAAPSAARGRRRTGENTDNSVRRLGPFCRMAEGKSWRASSRSRPGDAMAVEPDTVKKLFLEATEKATLAERAAFLDGACAADAALRRRVEALLLAHDQPHRLLDQPAVERPGG